MAAVAAERYVQGDISVLKHGAGDHSRQRHKHHEAEHGKPTTQVRSTTISLGQIGGRLNKSIAPSVIIEAKAIRPEHT